MQSRHYVLSLAACALLHVAAAHADGPGAYRQRPGASAASPATEAQDAYDAGVAFIEQAAKQEQQAQAAQDARATAKARANAANAYERALSQFAGALRLEPAMYEAHTYVGYANRKLGRHERALEAYAAALALKPDYGPAIEYQGEAFLGLGRIDGAKLNYLRLYALAPPLADKLLKAMQKWVALRQQEAQGTDPAAIDALSRWVNERLSHVPGRTDSGAAATGW